MHKPVHLIELQRNHCRWMVGEPTQLWFCGAPVEQPGAHFCAGHATLVYMPWVRLPRVRAR
jgi:hypothetical protein